jgi:Tol biopolymer transport system component
MHRYSKPIALLSFVFASCLLIACKKGGGDYSGSITPPPPTGGQPTGSTQPALTGKIVYHRYAEYGGAAKMFVFDFTLNQLMAISENWNLFDPINAHFNPDGTKIVFMAEAKQNGKWDIYLWTLGSADNPLNLTAGDNCRDEDPKFSPDGHSICFKQTPADGNGNLKIMDLKGHITRTATNDMAESGMPYFSANGQSLVYARGAGSTSDIFMINIDGSGQRVLENESGLQEYYPIVWDSSSFLFARWYSSSNQNDQIYLGYFSGGPATRLKLNELNSNSSDPFPCGTDYLFFSGTRSGTRGGYDLYIADALTGNAWSLSVYYPAINSEENELGICYSSH